MLIDPIASVTLGAPAKINLALHVTGRRSDGYHLLETLAVFTALGDRVTVAASDADRFAVSGRFAGSAPADASNLVLRALAAVRRRFPYTAGRPVSITLEKNLPVASGIGGGSSDAAAALKALARVWELDCPPQELAALALPLGADLPMCLQAAPLIARGIGENLAPVAGFPALPMALVNPGVAIATADVFRALERRDNPGLPPLSGRLDFGSICDWLSTTRNDLQAPAITVAPAIGEALDALAGENAAFARMSGSGATCFGLFESDLAAERAAAAIRDRHPGWFVAATASMASGETP